MIEERGSVSGDPPRVFISYSTQDKKRFVVDFARRLRARGVNVWLAEWEVLPGDSLVDRIFEEGIGKAAAFIVVLSECSLESRWVREELNAGIVKRIEDESKLIPVLIDPECRSLVPAALKSTLWEEIEDVSDYDASFERIVRATFHGRSDEKPPLAPPPAYVKLPPSSFAGLTPEDRLLLKLSCEAVLDRQRNQLGVSDVVAAAQKHDLRTDKCTEIIDILDRKGYLKARRVMGPTRFAGYSVTPTGFHAYASAEMRDYTEVATAIGLRILNHHEKWDHEIATALQRPVVLVDLILQIAELQAYVKTRALSGGRYVVSVYPEFRRALQAT